MSTPTTARRAQEIALDRIEAGGNVRELDAEHVTALAGSMAVRGLIVPIAVRPLDGERFALVAGEHRLAAARELGWPTITAVISDQAEGTSGDQGAENVLRKTLTPLEEARAVEKMLADGYTIDGAATVLGWHKRRVTARRRILELPESAQTLVGTGEIPIAGIDALLEIQAVSAKLAALVAGWSCAAKARSGRACSERASLDPLHAGAVLLMLADLRAPTVLAFYARDGGCGVVDVHAMDEAVANGRRPGAAAVHSARARRQHGTRSRYLLRRPVESGLSAAV